MMGESASTFAARHGGQPVEIDGLLVFADGARCEAGILGGGCREEPSDNLYERQKVIVSYFERRATRASSEFTDLKQTLLNHSRGVANGRPGFCLPDPREMQLLEDLATEARRLKERLSAEKEKLENLSPKSVSGRDALRASTSALGNGFAERVKGINI